MKCKQLKEFLKVTKKDVLTFKPSNYEKATWYLDAAFGAHYDYMSHIGADVRKRLYSHNFNITESEFRKFNRSRTFIYG
jgi:hypothetical protein